MQIVLLAVVVLMPLLFMPGVFFYFDTTPKIGILLFAIPALFVFCKGNVKSIRSLWTATDGRVWIMLLAAQFVGGAASALLSADPALAINGSLWRRCGWITETAVLIFVFFAAAWLAGGARRKQALLRAITAAGLAGAIYGICQYLGADPFLPPKTYEAGEGIFTIVRPPGTIGHADYFANWLLMAAFFAIALERIESSRAMQIACRAAIGIMSLAIVLTGTRAAWLGLLAGFAVLIFSRGVRFTRAAWITGAAAAALLIVFAMAPAGARLRARLHWSMDDAGGGARLLLWRDSLRMVVERPGAWRSIWFGSGQETFTTEFPRFASVELARAYPDFYQESPHNAFLDALVSRGIVGWACMIGFAALGIVAGWRARRSGDVLGEPLLAGWIATLVCLQFTVLVAATALYFYLMAAMLVSLRAASAEAESPRRVALAYWIAAAASLAFPIFAARLMIADRFLTLVQQRIAVGDATGASLWYADALQWLPRGAGFDLTYSRAMAQLATHSPVFGERMKAWGEAKEAGIRATSNAEDRQNAWYSLATLYAAENDPGGVERCLRTAIACAPNWFKPHWTLANLLEMTGRHGEAMTEAGVAVERDAGRDPEVLATWTAVSSKSR